MSGWAASASLLSLLLVLQPSAVRSAADEITFSTLQPYSCRAAFAGGRYKLYWAIDRSKCPGQRPWPTTRFAGLHHHRRRRALQAAGGGDLAVRAVQTARWQAKRMNETLLSHHEALDAPLCPEAEVALAVVVEFRGEAAAQAKQHGWWLAFGIGEAGGMRGVDFVRYDSKSSKLVDAHTARHPGMVADARQDWQLAAPANVTLFPRSSAPRADGSRAAAGLVSWAEGGAQPQPARLARAPREQPSMLRATVHLRRRVRTDDARYDREFVADPARRTAVTRVVGQWGVGHYDAEQAAASAPLAVGASGAPIDDAGGFARYVRGSLRLLTRCSADPFAALRRDPTVARVEVRVQAHAVATRRSSGWGYAREVHTYACVNLEHIKGIGGRHFDGNVVGIAPLLTHGQGPRAPLRHLTLLGYRQHCPDEGTASPELRASQLRPDSLEALYFWAPGAAPLLLPPDAGIRLGGRHGYRALVLKLWYEALDGAAALGDGAAGDGAAPAGIADEADVSAEAAAELARAAGGAVQDQSGVSLFVTQTARAHDAGLLQLGDAQLGLIEQRLPEGSSVYKFSCPSDCSTGHFGGKALHVYARAMHMRGHGERIVTTMRARNGSIVHRDAVRALRRPSAALSCSRPGARLAPCSALRLSHARRSAYLRLRSTFSTGAPLARSSRS